MGNNLKTAKKKRFATPREKMPTQSADERIKNFKEVATGFTEEQALNEANRCLHCKKPKCVEGCPVRIDIPGFIQKIKDKDPLGAAKILKENNLLPAVCGRVCPQEDQCEKLCIIGKKHTSVAIGALERYAADYETAHGKDEEIVLPEPTGKKVAIVGSGPAGLACAGDLAKMGHAVTIFEALHKPGGVLVYGIPEFRLPKSIVEKEINQLKKLGVILKLNYIIGKIKTVEELFKEDGFDAVFMGNGAGLPVFMGIPGENHSGVYSANEYLTRANLMKAYKFPEYDTPVKRGGKIAVIGGGNVAMDAVRTALRLDAESALIIYRRSRDEMPARKEEIEHAEEEGVKFNLLTNPIQIIGDENGKVRAVECIKMKLGEPDSSGRRRPVPIAGSEFEIEVNAVIMSIGSSSNPLVAKSAVGLEFNKWGNIVVESEETGKTAKKGIYAGGDIVTGAATVILAMGAGRSAASAIDEYLTGLD